MIQSTITNDCIKVNLDDGNVGKNSEICQRVIFQVSVRELRIDILNKYSTCFPMEYKKKEIVHMSDYDI